MTSGDTFKATIIGGTVTAYINGTRKLQVTDSQPFPSGSPGIGFYLANSRGIPAPQAEYGLSSFSATDELNGSTSSVLPSSQAKHLWVDALYTTEYCVLDWLVESA
jgi:hypothetical protein